MPPGQFHQTLLDGERLRLSLTGQDALERADTLRVERRAAPLAQEGDRKLVRPGLAVDTLRDQGVVDVADRQDPDVEGIAGPAIPCGYPEPSRRS